MHVNGTLTYERPEMRLGGGEYTDPAVAVWVAEQMVNLAPLLTDIIELHDPSPRPVSEEVRRAVAHALAEHRAAEDFYNGADL